jgi:hypothetical protein
MDTDEDSSASGGAESRADASATPASSLIGLVERLLAGTAVASAALYVLINALYVEFYDDFGIRPEDVGWDRLTVLSRSALLALVLIPAATLLGYAYDASKRANASSAPNNVSRRRRSRITWSAAVVAALLMIPLFVLAKESIERHAREVRNGGNTNGIQLWIPLVDVQANEATVIWLADEDKRPVDIAAGPKSVSGAGASPASPSSTYLTYLGRGPDVAVFVKCGRQTIILPASEILVSIVSTKEVGDLDKTAREAQQARFDRACPGVRGSKA